MTKLFLQKDLIKIVFSLALAILLIVGVMMTVLSSARVMNALLGTYILGVEDCRFENRPPSKESIEICSIDYNEAKREIADNVALLIFALPLSYLAYDQFRRMIK
ncbi:MAG: hypothetical protein F4X82_00640 [Candidatus Spechtbacteria bacterium SB0662_bin_43]|uniref:Uncharacterized protein n=1 Tax=Candidatus Spechtbacteria bacterium SB0662_bin_43 TaxID=2604897 RepID=A0A845DBJ6_9BACT|nr:hypothetical protein [Candidatus Spechtbacteria bacterium SB0662_bin_43]